MHLACVKCINFVAFYTLRPTFWLNIQLGNLLSTPSKCLPQKEVTFNCHTISLTIMARIKSFYSRTPLIRPPSESHWCGRIRGMVAREGFVYEQKPLSVTRNVVVWEGWSLVRVVVRQGFYCIIIYVARLIYPSLMKVQLSWSAFGDEFCNNQFCYWDYLMRTTFWEGSTQFALVRVIRSLWCILFVV